MLSMRLSKVRGEGVVGVVGEGRYVVVVVVVVVVVMVRAGRSNVAKEVEQSLVRTVEDESNSSLYSVKMIS